MEAQQTLSEFLEDRLPVYYNPAGVDFYLNADGSLFICADYPGIEQKDDIFLELFQEVKTVDALMSLLHMSRAEHIDRVTPEDLIRLYDQGKINIVCTLEGVLERELSFRKHKNNIWARNTREEIHQVTKHLQKPEDFITYTLNYYAPDLVKNN